MSQLKANLLANFTGTAWSTLIQIICTPLYIRLLGAEGYGLLGFNLVLQQVLQVLDFGISPTMNREMARYSVRAESDGEACDFVRTLEVAYWLVGLVIGALLIALAPFVAHTWLQASALPDSDVRQALTYIGAISALQWPLSLYQAGLMGLQRHPILNGLKIVIRTTEAAGAVLILSLVSRSITTFFLWQIVVSAVHVTLATLLLWRSLPRGERPARIRISLIGNVWRFAAGMSGITLSALVLTQLDKIFLSKLLSLELFGYYTVATTVANGLAVIVGPVFNAVFPRFSSLANVAQERVLGDLYHRTSQLMAVLLFPLAVTISLFSHDILLLWTRDIQTAHMAAPITSVLVVGTALNGMMFLPYALQLAHGWTSLALRINILFGAAIAPAIILLVTRYGVLGGAVVWPSLNAIYMAVGVPLTHRRVLKGHARQWFIEDIGLPVAAAVLIALVGRVLLWGPMSHIQTLIGVGTIFALTCLTAILAAGHARTWAYHKLITTLPVSGSCDLRKLLRVRV